MEQFDSKTKKRGDNLSDTQSPVQREEEARQMMDMPTIKIPDGARLKNAAAQQKAAASQQKTDGQPRRKPSANGQRPAGTGQKKAAANGQRRPAGSGQKQAAANGQKRSAAAGQRRPAGSRPQNASINRQQIKRTNPAPKEELTKPAEETVQESPLDKLQSKLHTKLNKNKTAETQNAAKNDKRQRHAGEQDTKKKQQNGGRFAPGPTLEERFEETLQQKKKKAFIIPIIAVAVILLSVFAILALHFFASINLDVVPNVHVHEITDFSITLAWDPVDHASGYHVFQRKDNSEDFVQIESTKERYCIIYGLEQATEYSFFVKAYNGSSESRDYEPVENVYTKLAPEHITNITSDEAGVIHVEWTPNNSADGYLLEFHTIGKNYREENKNVISAGQTSFNITNLSPRSHIGVRVTGFVNREGTEVMGTASDEKAIRVSDGTGTGWELLPTEHPMIALTFDDGPGGESSDRILDVLEKYNVKATFFMVGENVEANPSNVQRKLKLGMELGNHTWNHENYGDDVTDDDIMKASEAIESVTGQWPSCFRSPGGNTTENILEECANENLPAYRWSIDTEDWKNLNADTVYKIVMENVQDGDIILLHEIYDSTADAVERLVPELLKQGYELVTCRELVKAKTGNDPELYTEYFDLK